MTAVQFRDPRSERIYRRLLQIGAGPAAFFSDAYQLMEGDVQLATRAHMVGHALRELESGVRSVLAAATNAPSGLHSDGTKVTAEEMVRHIASALDLASGGSVIEGWISLTASLHGIAHRRNLLPPRPLDERLNETWLTMLSVLDQLLDRFESRYADVFTRLDRLVEIANPNGGEIDEFIKTIPHTPQVLDYFYARLTSPGWFPGLRKRGAFEDPPQPVEDPEQGTIAFPPWAAAEYLKRMADQYPVEVSRIISSLDTSNLRAQDQAIEVALELPPRHAVSTISRIQGWIPGMVRFRFFGKDVVALIERLAAAGEGNAAAELVGPLLAPPEIPESDSADRLIWRSREEVPYFLQERAKELFASLAAAVELVVIDLIAEPLEQRLRAEHERAATEVQPEDFLGTRDYSTIWLPNLRSEPPHRAGEMPGFLALHLRLVLDQLVRVGVSISDIAAALRVRNGLVFRRIELDLVASHGTAARDLARASILDRRFFEEPEVRAEYASLIVGAFGMLEHREQKQLLEWIAAGRDVSWEPDEKARAVWRELNERDWLAALADHLDEEHANRLDHLVQEHGEAKAILHNDSTIGFWSGPTSPVEHADLATMSVDDLLSLLRGWVPVSSSMSPSHEGLARSVADVVAASPDRFASSAADFAGLEATYVRGLLNGFDTALREKRYFPWKSVITLGNWVVAQPVGPDEPAEAAPFDRDADFRPARRALASLLKRGLALRDDGAPPLEEREGVWEVIRVLAEDCNPSPEYEARWGGENMDPASLALNTVRPSAITAAIEYAFWVNHHSNELEQPIGMAVVPEVRQLLERTLDPRQDPSPAVRAAIGYELGQLVWFDDAWVKRMRDQLFPANEHLLPLRLALFDTFLRYGWKTKKVLETIPEEYVAAVLRAGIDRGNPRGEQPDNELADHLMTLYWWGSVPLELEPDLVSIFFATVPADFRKRAIHFVGWSLFRTEKPIDPEPLKRLQELWEWRTIALDQQMASPQDAFAARAERSEFGWWFAARAFEVEWALSHLQAVLRELGMVEWAHEVGAYLADLVDDHPREVIDTLALFDPAGAGDIHSVQYWLDDVIRILRRCFNDEDTYVREAATQLIHRWVAHGHLRLRDLLDP
jgi:hypothetical protein